MRELSDVTQMYFGKIDDTVPFSGIEEQSAGWMRFLDLLCFLALDERDSFLPTAYDRVGSRQSEADAYTLVTPPDEGWDSTAILSREVFEVFYALYQKGLSEDDKPLFPLSRVIAPGMSHIEILAVIVAYGAGMNRKYSNLIRRICEEDDTEVCLPTIGLVADLARFFLEPPLSDIAPLLDMDSYVNRALFIDEGELREQTDALSRTIRLRPSVLSYIATGEPVLGDIFPCGSFLHIPEDVSKETICLKECYGEIKKALSESSLIELSGAEGSGRRYLTSCGASETGRRVVSLDVKLFSGLISENQRRKCISDLIFLGQCTDTVIYLWCTGDPEHYSVDLRNLITSIRDFVPTICIGAAKPVSEDVLGGLGISVYRIEVPEISSRHQAILWQEAAAAYDLSFDKDYSLDMLVSKYVMSPGRIYETMGNVAVAQKGIDKKTIDESILEEQIRRSCSVQFGESATRLSSPFTWEDLMISPESESLLRMASDRVKYRATVNEGFGFAKKLPYGRGVAIVLYGPPGTGKTMAAQVLANDLGLDIYRIDLSQVSSKYIGETEKNLGVVFDAAKNSNAILFFDEADSLFSKRTEVSSSNDKYANAETSYLLQKIEEYSGVSVLATNNMQNFDAAFKRRMTFMIPIEAPGEETRIRLWESVFPPDAPLDPLVDIRVLAHAAELTGSSIKSAAVTAAYLAAAAGRSIKWDDLVRAVELEGLKTGTLGLGQKLRDTILTGVD